MKINDFLLTLYPCKLPLKTAKKKEKGEKELLKCSAACSACVTLT